MRSRGGGEIAFVFEYHDGPFHMVFRWHAGRGTWRWLMGQKNTAGTWQSFADLTLTKLP